MTNLKPKSYYQYIAQKFDAKKRGIEFLLTYDEWLTIWVDSGQLKNRGPHKGQYCMARFEDKGPYKVGNVKIILSSENVKEIKPDKKSDTSRKWWAEKREKAWLELCTNNSGPLVSGWPQGRKKKA